MKQHASPTPDSADAVYVIAEVGSNHNRDFACAQGLIDAAADAGADAVKFQTFYADDFIPASVMPADYGLEDVYPGKSWQEVLRERLILPFDWYPELVAYVRQRGLDFVATVHGRRSLEFVMRFQPRAIKIASMDLTNTPLLQTVSRAGVPMLVSLGMGSWADIERAVAAVESEGPTDLTLMHCVSEYPTDYENLNLRFLSVLAATFAKPVGFSDHSLGVVSSVAAVALGARTIEKHITLDRNAPGPDHSFALEPRDLQRLVREVRQASQSLGTARRIVSPGERRNVQRYRRRAVARGPLARGTVLGPEHIALKRPGCGIAPFEMDRLWGRSLLCDLDDEQPLTWHCVGDSQS